MLEFISLSVEFRISPKPDCPYTVPSYWRGFDQKQNPNTILIWLNIVYKQSVKYPAEYLPNPLKIKYFLFYTYSLTQSNCYPGMVSNALPTLPRLPENPISLRQSSTTLPHHICKCMRVLKLKHTFILSCDVLNIMPDMSWVQTCTHQKV